MLGKLVPASPSTRIRRGVAVRQIAMQQSNGVACKVAVATTKVGYSICLETGHALNPVARARILPLALLIAGVARPELEYFGPSQ